MGCGHRGGTNSRASDCIIRRTSSTCHFRSNPKACSRLSKSTASRPAREKRWHTVAHLICGTHHATWQCSSGSSFLVLHSRSASPHHCASISSKPLQTDFTSSTSHFQP